MRLPFLSRILLCAVATLSGTASAVRADFITGQLVNAPIDGGILNPGTPVTINLGDGSAPSTNYYPGEVNWTVEAGPTDKPNASWVPGVGSPFQTFCIELTQDINPGKTYTYSLVDLASAPNPGTSQNGNGSGMGDAKANAIAALWAADYGYIANPTGGSTANINAAAFQLAIWKIEYDWGNLNFTFTGNANHDFSNGNFRASNSAAAITQADTWLNSLGWNSNSVSAGSDPEASLVALSNPNLQDQVMALPTPVPPTLYLASIGGVILILYGYRRRPAMNIAPV